MLEELQADQWRDVAGGFARAATGDGGMVAGDPRLVQVMIGREGVQQRFLK